MNSCRGLGGIAIAIIALLASEARSQPIYEVGDIVENFELIDRATGQPVQLYDLAGQVIFLEWFAWWCPFCQAAAAEIGPGIVEHYKSQGGTAKGADFVHVGLNLQGGNEIETQEFIDANQFGLVLNDFSRAVADRFQVGGQPIFAIINGIANSPSHEQWELLYTQLGYGQLDFPIATFREAIDSVEPSAGGTLQAYLDALQVEAGQRGEEDDPDGDGLPNAWEYFLAGAGDSAGSQLRPRFGALRLDGQLYLTIEYRKDAAVSDVAAAAQFSDDLAFSSAAVGVVVEMEEEGERTRVLVRSPSPLGTGMRFGRLALSLGQSQ